MKRLDVIAKMTVAMSRAATLAEIYREAFDAVAKVAGPPRASIVLFDRDGVLRFEAWRGLSDAYRSDVEAHTRWKLGQVPPAPLLIADVRVAAELAEGDDVREAEGIRSLASFPLITGGGAIGAFTVYFDDAPHVFEPELSLVLQNIAAHTAFAIDRQRAVDLLRAERSLFAGGPTVVLRWHNAPGWALDYVSPNAQAQLGYADAELLRRGFASIVHEGDTARFAAELEAHALAGDASFETEVRIAHASGNARWMYAHTVIVRDAAGTATQFLGYLLDTTERKNQAEMLRAAEARLRESQRLEALGVLAGGIAHDFNNLLVGVLGNASQALALLPEGPAQDTVRDIQTAARMASDLTRQLLAYSGKGRFVVEPLDISRLVADSAHLLGAVLSRKATVTHALAEGLPSIEGDATQLRQVAMNLLTNASDALDDAPGHITVSTGVEDVPGGRLRGAFPDGEVRAGRYVFLEVKDTGHGMPEEQLPRIFDPFFTSKFQGRGLGLAAVLGIVRGHGGAILVDSTPGVGTTFRLLLPAHGEHVRPPLAKVPASAPPVESAATVLVVDDEPVVRRLAQRVLERAGYRVLVAENGREALRVVEEQQGAVNVVLLDLTMPELSGEETFEALAVSTPRLPVVMTSGYSEETSTHLTERGLAGFLEKPYTAEELLEVIRRVLSTRRASPG